MSVVSPVNILTMSYIYVAMPIFTLLLVGYSIAFYLLSRKIRLNKDQNTTTSSHRAIEARRPIIIYFYILSILVIISIERPISIYCWVSSECGRFSQYLSPVIFAFAIYAHFYIFLVRTWILYYEINFNLAKKDIVWQKHLYLNYLSPSNKFNKSKQDWFLENRHRYGSPKWIFTKILCIPYILSCAACIIVGVSVDYHHYFCIVTNALLLAFPVICILIIWRAINPIHDFYRIRAELRITLFLWIILCLLIAVNIIIFNFAAIHVPEQYALLESVLTLWYVGVAFTVNGLVSTAWIYHLTVNKYFEYSPKFVSFEMEKLQRTFENKSVLQRISHKIVPSTSRTANNMESVEVYAGVPRGIPSPLPMDEDTSKDIESVKSSQMLIAERIYSSFPLRDILVTDTGFRLFMQHMSSEYSAESLLFLVEVVRYKYALNGFKKHEMYSVATNRSLATVLDDGLTWYLPLPQSLVADVVKQPDIEQLKSIHIKINEDLSTLPHAAATHLETDDTKTTHLEVKKPKKQQKKDRGRTKSKFTKNPLFHNNINIENEAKQDGALNEIKEWDEAKYIIAWGTLSHALMIYEKYIKLNSLFEINISHRLRMKLKKEFAALKELYMENHEEIINGKLEDIVGGDKKFSDNILIFSKYPEKRKELEVAFDGTAKQIEMLMNDSYVRFRQTQTYHRLLKQLIKDQRKNGKNNKDNFFNNVCIKAS